MGNEGGNDMTDADMVTVPRSTLTQAARIEMLAREFVSGWRKGDFELSRRAVCYVGALESALLDSPQVPTSQGDEA